MKGNYQVVLPWEKANFTKSKKELAVLPQDFVTNSLQIKLLNFHHSVAQAAAAYSIDEGVSLYDFFERVNNEVRGEYLRLLETYNFIADNRLSALVESLLHWKISEIEKEKTKTKTPLLEKIRFLTEYLYCRILLALLQKWNAPANDIDPSLSRTIVDFSLESFTLNSGLIMTSNEQSKIYSKPKLSDPKEPECFTTYRNELQELHANILGEISRRCYDVVVYPFFELFKQISGNVSECIEFTKAIRYVSLPNNLEDLEKSKSFIDSALQYVHKKQKIELTQAVFYLIGYALLPFYLGHFDPLHPSWISFQTFISGLYAPCKKFWKKFKDSAPAMLLEIAILCNGDTPLMERSFMSIVDKLIKYAKVPEKRGIALECLFYTIFNLFVRLSTSNEINHETLVEKLLIELYHTSKKAVPAHTEESLAILVDIVHLLFYFYKKDVVFNQFIIQNLHPDYNHERINIGLKAFIAIADDLHITFDNTYIYSRRKNMSFANTISRRNYSLKKGLEGKYQKNPLDNSLISSFQNSLEQIFRMVDAQVGNLLQYNQSGRSHTEINAKDKSMVDLLFTLICTFSRIPPSNMQTSELITVLIKYCFHIDPKICTESKSLLVNLIKTRPSLRIAIVEEIGKFILSIPEENPILIKQSVAILIEIFTDWCDPSVIGALEPNTDYIDASIQNRGFFTSALFEGLSLILLCSPYSAIRCEALKLLSHVKNLNQDLPNDISDKEVYYVIKEMKSHKKELMNMTKDIRGTFPTVCKNENVVTTAPQSLRDFVILLSKGDQEEVGHFIGKLPQKIYSNCKDAFGVAFTIICMKIEQLNPIILANQKRDNFTTEQLILWRNYITLALSIGLDEPSSIAVEAGYSSGATSVQKLLELTLPALLQPSERIRDALHLALGYCRLKDAYAIPDNVAQLIEGVKKKEASNLRDAIRMEASHIFCMLSVNITAESLFSSHLKRYFDYITETLEFLTHPANENAWSLEHLRFDFFRVCGNIFKHGFASKLSVESRKQLLQFALSHCGFGPLAIEQKEKEMKLKDMTMEKSKDSKLNNTDFEVQFELSVSLVQYWALHAINGLLMCEIDYDMELISENGIIFALISDIFERAEQSATIDLGISILVAFIQYNIKNQETIIKSCVTKIFLSSLKVSNGYFFGIVEVVTKGGDLNYHLPVLLNLCFYQMVHNELEVRRSAIELLHWMSTRFFRTQQNTFQLRMNSLIYDRSFNQLYKISLEFSEKHEELRLDLLDEVVQRIKDLKKKDQIKMVSYITAWLSIQDLSELDEELLTATLERLVVFTAHFSAKCKQVIEDMWKSLARIDANISIIFNFIQSCILQRAHTRLSVFLKICVYISEVAPKEMISILVSSLFPKQREVENIENASDTFPHAIRSISSDINDGGEEAPPAVTQELMVSSSPSNLSWDFSELFPTEHHNNKKNNNDDGFDVHKGSFAVIVLPELVLDHTAIWIDCVIPILHASILYMDHQNNNIYNCSKILLKNLIFQLIAKQKETSEEVKAYKLLVKIIEKSKNKPLWTKAHAHTLSSTLEELISLVITSLSSINDLLTQWGDVALEVAMTSSEYHFIFRSLQIFRAMCSTPNRGFIITLTKILRNFLTSRRSEEITEISQEIISTLLSIITRSTSSFLISAPEIFWIGVSLLRGNNITEYKGGIEIIIAYIKKSNFENVETQTALISTLPKKWDPNFYGLPIYVLKGLCISSLEESARQLLQHLIQFKNVKNEVMCSEEYPDHVLIYVIGILPHLLTSFGGDDSQLIASHLYELLINCAFHSLANIVIEYPRYRKTSEGIRRFLLEVISLLSKQYLPKFEVLIFMSLLEMLNRGPSRHKKTVISMIEAFLDFLPHDQSHLLQYHIYVFAPLINLLEGENWSVSIKVINLLSSISPKTIDDAPHLLESTTNPSPSSSPLSSSQSSITDQNTQLEKLKSVLSSSKQHRDSMLSCRTDLVINSLRFIIDPLAAPEATERKNRKVKKKKKSKSIDASVNNKIMPLSANAEKKESKDEAFFHTERRKTFLPLPTQSTHATTRPLISMNRQKHLINNNNNNNSNNNTAN